MDLSHGGYLRKSDNPGSAPDQSSMIAASIRDDFYALAEVFSISADECRDPLDRARIGECHALSMRGVELASSLARLFGRP